MINDAPNLNSNTRPSAPQWADSSLPYTKANKTIGTPLNLDPSIKTINNFEVENDQFLRLRVRGSLPYFHATMTLVPGMKTKND